MQIKTTNHLVPWLNLTIAGILQFSTNWWQSCLLYKGRNICSIKDAALKYRLLILQRSWLWSRIVPRFKSWLRHWVDGKISSKELLPLWAWISISERSIKAFCRVISRFRKKPVKHWAWFLAHVLLHNLLFSLSSYSFPIPSHPFPHL